MTQLDSCGKYLQFFFSRCAVVASQTKSFQAFETNLPTIFSKSTMVTVLDFETIRQLASTLDNVDVGDRVIDGRIYLFSVQKPEPELAATIEDVTRSPNWQMSSSLGPLTTSQAKNLLIHLIEVYRCGQIGNNLMCI